MTDFVPCPHCGAEIKADANFCRHCGSSDTDGWSETWADDAEDDFDYEEFAEENFSPRVTNTQTHPLWRLTAALLLAAGAFILYTMAAGIF
jgi:hypothetical protein